MTHKEKKERAQERRNTLFFAPMAVLAVLLVALPLIYVLGMSLTANDGSGFTLANYKAMLRADYLLVFANSLKLAFYTTALSLLIGYPFGYCMARAPRRWKGILMMLVIIPAAYAFARLEFRGRNALFALFLSCLTLNFLLNILVIIVFLAIFEEACYRLNFRIRNPTALNTYRLCNADRIVKHISSTNKSLGTRHIDNCT